MNGLRTKCMYQIKEHNFYNMIYQERKCTKGEK